MHVFVGAVASTRSPSPVREIPAVPAPPPSTSRSPQWGADTGSRPGWRALGILAPALAPRRRTLAIAALAAIGSQLIGVPLALVVRRLVARHDHTPPASESRDPVTDAARHLEAAASGIADDRWTTLAPLAAIFLGVILIRGWLRWLQTSSTERVAAGVVADLRHRMHDRLHHVGLGYFDRRPVGRTIVRFTGDAGAIRGWIQSVLVRLPADLLTIIAVATALVVIHPALLPAAAAPLLALIPVMLLLHPRIRRWTRDGRRAQSRLSGLLATRIPTIPAFRCFGRTAGDDRQVGALIDEIARAQAARGRVDAWVHGSAMAAGTASVAGVALVGLMMPTIGGGDLVAAIWLTLMLRGPVMRLGRAGSTHQRAMVSFDRIAALAGRPSERGLEFVGPPPPITGRSLAYRGVGYRDHRGHWRLRDTDATVHGPGLHVLDGPISSSSVALDLVVRLRRPHTGRIELDGHDLRSLPLDHLRRCVALIDRDRSVVDVASATEPEITARRLASGVDVTWTAHIGPNPLERLQLAVRHALVSDPAVLLVDDPLRDLSAHDRATAIRMLRDLAVDRLLVVTGRDADLIAAGSPVPLDRTAPVASRRARAV